MNRDITRCQGYTETDDPCPLMDKCLRYTMPPDFIVQWSMYAPGRYVYDVQGEAPDWVCGHFILDKEEA